MTHIEEFRANIARLEQQRDEARAQPIRVNVPMRKRSGIQDAEAA